MMNEERPSTSFGEQSETGTSNVNTPVISKEESPVDKKYQTYRSQIVGECGIKLNTAEAHLKRMQSLRNELNYIKETEWMYESVDKKPPAL